MRKNADMANAFSLSLSLSISCCKFAERGEKNLHHEDRGSIFFVLPASLLFPSLLSIGFAVRRDEGICMACRWQGNEMPFSELVKRDFFFLVLPSEKLARLQSLVLVNFIRKFFLLDNCECLCRRGSCMQASFGDWEPVAGSFHVPSHG